MKKEDIEKYNVTVTGLNESDMSTKDALAAGYITQTGFAESINSTTAGDPVASGSEGHSTEGHSTEGHSTEGHSETGTPGSTSETTGSNPTGASSETGTPGSTSETTGSNPTEGHSETSDPGSTSETTGSNPTEGHSETSDPGSTGETTGSNPTEGHSETGNTTTIGGNEFPNDKSVFVANAGSALIKIAALSSKDLDSLVSLYKLDQESTWPSAADWKKMNVVTKRSTVKSALGLA